MGGQKKFFWGSIFFVFNFKLGPKKIGGGKGSFYLFIYFFLEGGSQN